MTATALRGHGPIVSELQSALAQLEAPAQWLEQHGTVLKSDGRDSVGIVEITGRPCYIKFFMARSRLQRIGFTLGLGRALRAFDAGEMLAAHGALVAEPLACLRLSPAMVLVTAAVDGGDMKALWQSGSASVEWPALMAHSAAALARLHKAGFVHGDCKWSNLLWSGNDVILVDLDDVRRSSRGGHRGRDLARFVLNAEELSLDTGLLDTFLKVYAENTGAEKEAVVELLAPPLTDLRRRHERKYGRRGVRLLEDIRNE